MTQSTELEVLKHFVNGGKVKTYLGNILTLDGAHIIDQDKTIWNIDNVFKDILKGYSSIYKEKPQLEWHTTDYISYHAYIGVFKSYTCMKYTKGWVAYCSPKNGLSIFLGFHETLDLAKEACHKHYEENNQCHIKKY